MSAITRKVLKASRLMLSNPAGFWHHMKPYFLKSREGKVRVNGVSFDIDLDFDPAMRGMSLGMYQSDIAALLKRFLREGDTFIDVGANIGYLSAFALGQVGASGVVHAFEPVPRYFQRLESIRADNPGYNLHVNEMAMGEKVGASTIAVTNLRNIGWNTMVPGYMDRDTIQEEIEIEVSTLDHYVASRDVRDIRMVKIDTEGYEFLVLKGFQETLRAGRERPILVIEVAPEAYPALNVSVEELDAFMREAEYVARSVDLKKVVEVSEIRQTSDIVFLPREFDGKGRRT